MLDALRNHLANHDGLGARNRHTNLLGAGLRHALSNALGVSLLNAGRHAAGAGHRALNRLALGHAAGAGYRALNALGHALVAANLLGARNTNLDLLANRDRLANSPAGDNLTANGLGRRGTGHRTRIAIHRTARIAAGVRTRISTRVHARIDTRVVLMAELAEEAAAVAATELAEQTTGPVRESAADAAQATADAVAHVPTAEAGVGADRDFFSHVADILNHAALHHGADLVLVAVGVVGHGLGDWDSFSHRAGRHDRFGHRTLHLHRLGFHDRLGDRLHDSHLTGLGYRHLNVGVHGVSLVAVLLLVGGAGRRDHSRNHNRRLNRLIGHPAAATIRTTDRTAGITAGAVATTAAAVHDRSRGDRLRHDGLAHHRCVGLCHHHRRGSGLNHGCFFVRGFGGQSGEPNAGRRHHTGLNPLKTHHTYSPHSGIAPWVAAADFPLSLTHDDHPLVLT